MTRTLRALVTVFAILAALFVVAPQASAQGRAVYVAPNGSDANPGTRAQPKATIVAAMRTLSGGGEIILRGGHYRISNNSGLLWQGGTAGRPLVVRSAPGERARLTSAPGSHCVYAAADHIQIRNITCTGWMGIGSYNASHIVFRGNRVHDLDAPGTQGIIASGNQSFRNVRVVRNTVERVPHSGIAVGDLRVNAVQNVVIKRNKVRQSNIDYRNRTAAQGGWGSGISAVGANGATVARNDVRRTFGEGINCALSTRCRIRKNTVVDAWGTLFYGDNSTHSVWEDNVAKSTSDTRFRRDYGFGPMRPAGFVFANEAGWFNGASRATVGNVVRNNVAIDVDTGFRFGEYQNGHLGMRETTVANNTFVRTRRCGFDLHAPGTNSGNLVANNLVVPAGGTHAFCGGNRGTTMRNNLWASGRMTIQPHSSSLRATPRFVGGGTLNPASYQLAPGSPGVNDGRPVAAVANDRRGVNRPSGGQYDIGAFER